MAIQVGGTTVIDNSRVVTSTGLTVDTNTLHVDSTNNRVGVGTSSPSDDAHISKSNAGGDVAMRIQNSAVSTGDTATLRFSVTSNSAFDSAFIGSDRNNALILGSNTAERMRINNTGSVGIGTSSIASDATLHVDGTNTVLLITEDSEGLATLRLGDTQGDLSQSFALAFDTGGQDELFFKRNNSTVGRWMSEGLVAGQSNATGPYTTITANNDATKAGAALRDTGYLAAGRYQGEAMNLNRMNNNGSIALFRKDGSVVGSIGTSSSSVFFKGNSSGALFINGNTDIRPYNGSTLSNYDNVMDIGGATSRFDDVRATNGTIQTSDQNEKQQIASLTDAEITAAKAISKLFKTFKWNDAVAKKGDAARTHTGVIAQDVQQAMTDAGLNAGDYAFFISDTWWETQTDVPAVEAVDEVLDEDGNVITEAVEAQEAYTRTDTYEVAGEAPEGATERTRLGIRYPELLSFIGAATEQRFASIEARLDALEA